MNVEGSRKVSIKLMFLIPSDMINIPTFVSRIKIMKYEESEEKRKTKRAKFQPSRSGKM